MRLRTALLLGALVAAAVAAGTIAHVRSRQNALAERLLRDTLERGVAFPVVTEGRVRVLMGARWQSGGASTRQLGRAALIDLDVGGSPVTVLDDGGRLWRLGDQSATPLGRSDKRVDWALLASNYRIRGGGLGAIIGRPCREVRLVSRRTGRTAEALWIDPGTRLVLVRETYDVDGHLVQASTVEMARFHDDRRTTAAVEQALALRPQAPEEQPLTDAEFADRSGFAPLRPAHVPKGYREIGLYARTCPHGRTYAELVYFDGLRVMSVLERPGGGPGGGGGRGQGHGWRRGQGREMESAEPALVDEGQAKTVRVRRGTVRVFLTGDLTQEEILRVINSIP